MDVSEPDTSYNYWLHDYPFRRKDVNTTIVQGVAQLGSPTLQLVQPRERERSVVLQSLRGVDLLGQDASDVQHQELPTPSCPTSGTLFANSQKKSDNLHILPTTQNIFPELNLTLEYDRFGGNGIMQNEKTVNKTFVTSANYLGKRHDPMPATSTTRS